MTCIEFFDSNAIENIFTCLTVKPDRVILIGDSGKQLASHAARYKNITDEKGLDIEFAYYPITRNDISGIVDRLSEIVETYDDCIFDLTGGDELYLTAAGMILERYSDKNIQMHRVNYLSRRAYDVDGDGNVISETEMPELTVRDCIRIYGGDIDRSAKTAFDPTPENTAELNVLWDVCRADPTAWNRNTGILAAADSEPGMSSALKTFLPDQFIEKKLRLSDKERASLQKMLDKLLKNKLIRTGYTEDGRFFVTYKNKNIKNCLTVSGRVLELLIYSAALNQKSGKKPFYNDVDNGVVIDWDGDVSTDTPDTVNEIDVMMVRGVVPVFVSCKNGKVKSDELYKLNTVANRFGGKYAKKILASANPTDSDNDVYFKQRAKEMGIRIIDGLCRYDEKGIAKELKKFWS